MFFGIKKVFSVNNSLYFCFPFLLTVNRPLWSVALCIKNRLIFFNCLFISHFRGICSTIQVYITADAKRTY